jgi:glycosyltransferase involved in cell wall biosynthesis
MRILFVASATSLHTVRWLNQLSGEGWDLHLFPVEPYPLQPKLRNVTLHHPVFRRRPFDERDLQRVDIPVDQSAADSRRPSASRRRFHASVRQRGLPWPFRSGVEKFEDLLAQAFPSRLSRAVRLAKTIEQLKPDIVHSLELHTAGYLTLAARLRVRMPFPPWMATNWGCDLHLFVRLKDHETKLREVLRACDFYGAECVRDVELARSFGFTGKALPVMSNAGGIEVERVQSLRQPGPSSVRRLIVLKGYQDWHGRSLVALRAIEWAADALEGYRLAIFLAPRPVRMAAELMSGRTKIPVEIVPWSEHDEILRLHGRARISIGSSISDGIPTSLVEAMVMGSFPIQSDTSCANEWLTDGTTGLIVPPEDPQALAGAIRLAAKDDDLVNRAATLNLQTARERLDVSRLRPLARGMYVDAVGKAKLRA